ncbi:VOC family protein [Arenimonas donghaensis]|uniref:Glyoxalase/fosfomycin resistance/dioxygenase domain-containing protein n=1 Tax=Arenimonas donghaensis DSM 18148 = HO3-R19 TaxID=1121014 RepID=A0A087MFP8_9GAMM|nr:VOC family protein [Arenimonas donghaensis]KFL35701.1 hypothetical protein N788_08160 [Arenimonas donghaensis DSM 18148 = HO3-R19]
MTVENALAGIAVTDATAAAKWYGQLIGIPGQQTMPGLYEWSLPRGGVLQVFEDAQRAGSSSVTFSVLDLDAHIAQFEQQGIPIGQQTRTDDVSTATIEDPDGNQVVIAEQHTDKVAR